jgi:streptogramin lyase
VANGPTASTQINPLVYTPATATQMVINGATVPIVVSEAGYAGPFVITGSSPNSTTCVPVNCTPATTGGSVTINVSPASIANLATLAVTDSTHNVTANIPLGVASAGGGPSIPGSPTFFADPLTNYTQPQFPVAGSDGRLWFSERNGGTGAFYAGAMTLGTGVAANYALPGTAPVTNAAALGPDGNVWYADGGDKQIDVVSTGGSIAVFSTNNLISIPDVLATGPDNQMWIYGSHTTGTGLMEMAPNGATFAPALTGSFLGTVTSMVLGPDGNMWFTQLSPQGIGMITPAGAVTLYGPSLSGTLNAGLAIGTDGCLWFTEAGTGAWVGKIRPSSGVITEYPDVNGVGDGINGIAEGGDGNLWYALPLINSVARITTNGTINHYSAGGGVTPTTMVLAPNGELWFVEQTASLGWLTY